MQPSKDADGQLIWDYHHGLPAQEIIERADGWLGLSSGPGQYFAPFSDGHPMNGWR